VAVIAWRSTAACTAAALAAAARDHAARKGCNTSASAPARASTTHTASVSLSTMAVLRTTLNQAPEAAEMEAADAVAATHCG